MTVATIPNRPAGTDTRSIEALLANFDAITNVINGQLDAGNMSSTGLQSLHVPGDLKLSAVAATPAGWLLCDGSAVSRTTYSALFAAIGTAFGAGDGSTTFNLPDLRGRVPVGAGTGSGLTARALAATGGEETHALTSGENGPHTHVVNDPGHSHSLQGSGASAPFAGGWPNLIRPADAGSAYLVPSLSGAFATAGTSAISGTGTSIASSGSGTGHNNMQPFQVINYFIKT